MLFRAASKKSYEREQRARRQAEEERDQARKDLVPCEATILELRYTAAVQAGNAEYCQAVQACDSCDVCKRSRRVKCVCVCAGANWVAIPKARMNFPRRLTGIVSAAPEATKGQRRRKHH